MVSVIITNILTLEINTVHILHYGTIIYTVIFATVGPLELHISEPGFVNGLKRAQWCCPVPPPGNLKSSIFLTEPKVGEA